MTAARPALLVLAHGRSGQIPNDEPACRLAAQLQASGRFSQVELAFLMSGNVAAACDALPPGEVQVLPLFMVEGYSVEQILRAVGASGRHLRFLPVLGQHPGLAVQLARWAHVGAINLGLSPVTTTMLLVAHGSRRNASSGIQTEHLAARLRRITGFAGIEAVYYEQEPLARDWSRQVATREVLIVPLFLSTGGHADRDIGNMMRDVPEGVRVAALPPLGQAPWLIDLALDLLPAD